MTASDQIETLSAATFFRPTLDEAEMVAVIDALLQAEGALGLLDARHNALHPVQRLRSLQWNLAQRLEDLLARRAELHEHAPSGCKSAAEPSGQCTVPVEGDPE